MDIVGCSTIERLHRRSVEARAFINPCTCEHVTSDVAFVVDLYRRPYFGGKVSPASSARHGDDSNEHGISDCPLGVFECTCFQTPHVDWHDCVRISAE